MKMESGQKDRVCLRQDGVHPGRQMGLSAMLCYFICVCVHASVCMRVCVGGGGGVPIQSVNHTLT